METTLKWTPLRGFTRDQVDTLSDGIAGVYRLSYKDPDDNYYVFFVSQCEDIKKDLIEHLDDNANACVSIKLKQKECAFRYAQHADLEIRKAAARLVYRHYQPACNDSEPEGQDDLNINLV